MKPLATRIAKIVDATAVDDIHTHLFSPIFKSFFLWGIDDLLVYHYLVAEAFRHLDLPYDKFWELEKSQQAELVWRALFLKSGPISEAARGVVTTLNRLGLDARKGDLGSIRKWYREWEPGEFSEHCLDLAKVNTVCMTNSPFDPVEKAFWKKGVNGNPRFVTGLRIDPLLLDWRGARVELRRQGYEVSSATGRKSKAEARRFLRDWTTFMHPRYAMVSVPPDFAYPSTSATGSILDQVVLPHCAETGLPLALMMGVRRAVNPGLRMAGDASGVSNLRALENLCRAHPSQKFLVTALARESQHELCVIARKFRNLHLFGCWWFTNIPSVAEEMTAMRLELLGFSFTAQHSDARVMDQLIYKWDHTREVVGKVLQAKYQRLGGSGWEPTDMELKRDISALFGGSYADFCGRSSERAGGHDGN